MSQTILRPLPVGTYTSAKAVIHFYEHATAQPGEILNPQKGVRLGDMDDVTLEVAVGEQTERQSKEYSTPTVVLSTPGDISVTFAGTFVQFSDTLRAASVMGQIEKRTQEAETGVEKSLPEPGVYFMNKYGLENIVVTKGGAPAVLNVDYEVDAISGQFETFVPDIEVTFDVKEFSEGFMSGIASSTGIRGAVTIRMVNRQGRRSLIVLHDVEIRPAGARQLVIEGTENSSVAITAIAYAVSGKPPGQAYGYEVDITGETEGGV